MNRRQKALGVHDVHGVVRAEHKKGAIIISWENKCLPEVKISCPELQSVELSLHGERLAGMTLSGLLTMWEVTTGRVLWQVQAQPLNQNFQELAFTEADRMISVKDYCWNTVEAFEAESGRKLS